MTIEEHLGYVVLGRGYVSLVILDFVFWENLLDFGGPGLGFALGLDNDCVVHLSDS